MASREYGGQRICFQWPLRREPKSDGEWTGPLEVDSDSGSEMCFRLARSGEHEKARVSFKQSLCRTPIHVVSVCANWCHSAMSELIAKGASGGSVRKGAGFVGWAALRGVEDGGENTIRIYPSKGVQRLSTMNG
ncbi:hypothetical protein M408DRAFT_328488 [Serendipita vermifera MAFF 305830]|uniref:Uncharacterized protein n=1 Tax=Serendipita vermifera MAFF 305830 TaxID=933852 RepID=A0A0C2XMC6_SERVB|nr:hypothetical protein M408DRAFT_328488 [Serendipita vermifera MAFF 305830]